MSTRDAPIGGQAILEGVMMRGLTSWAVAVREATSEAPTAGPGDAATESGTVRVESFGLSPWTRRHRLFRWPIVRGVVALAESLALGFRALGISANAQLPEGERDISGGAWAGTVVFAVALAVGVFFLLPVGLTSLIRGHLGSSWVFWVVEGVIRTAIFLGYLWLVTRLRDLRRVFEYHGAEHKTIACHEGGQPLTPANAARYSRLHPRCGTAFLLVVMVVAIFVFAPLGLLPWYGLVASRILGVPVIAGISFEIIKWAGRNRRRRWVRAVMWPGLQLQKLTTREPDHGQLAVAIAALEAVLAAEGARTPRADELVGVEVVA